MKPNVIIVSTLALLWTLVGTPASALSTGCDLAFLPGDTTAPTMDGSLAGSEWSDATEQVSGGGTCMLSINNATSLTTTDLRPVRILSKRDNSNLYLAFDVEDTTVPSSIRPVGDKVVVQINPNNSRDSALIGDERRLVVTTMRGSPGSNSIAWQARSTTGGWGVAPGVTVPGPTGNTWTLTNNVQVGIQDRPSGTPGYVVEIKIPFAAIGYTLGSTPATIRDIGVAIAVINDRGFEAELVVGEGNTTVLSAASFPETTVLHVSDSNDPLGNIVGLAWLTPANWGTGYLTGAGDALWIDRGPPWWMSNDISVASCAAVNFTSPSDTANWYRYNSSATCPARVWARIHRTAPSGAGDVKRRVLFLWAEHGANPQKWHFVHLTDPLTDPLVLAPGAVVTTRGKQWTPPAGKPNHPCLRAFILPENLTGTYDPAWFMTIGGETGNNETRIQEFVSHYGLAEPHFAQMNLERIDIPTATCPTCVTCPGCVSQWDIGSWIFASTGFISVAHAETVVGKDYRSDDRQTKDHNEVVVDFHAEGVVPGAAVGKRYRYVESLGGVRKIITTRYLEKNPIVPLTFNVSNSQDSKRVIWVTSKVAAPAGGPTVVLAQQARPMVYERGETRKQRVVATATGIKDGGCPPKFSIGGGTALLGGLFAIGFVTFRRRRSDNEKG